MVVSSAPRLLFINQHYYPAFVAAGQHLTDLAEYLAVEGFTVHVLCGQSGYEDEIKEAPVREVHNGVLIRRFRMVDFGRGSNLGRIVDYATFYMQVFLKMLLGRPYDCVITLTTPPLLGLIGSVVRRIRGQRYGIWSMDLHPDAEEALGMLKPGHYLARVLHALNVRSYRDADFVVDLGAYMKQRLLNKGVRGKRLRTVPVWNTKEEVYAVPRQENPLVARLRLEDKFVIMYSGNAGLAHRFEEVLEAMRRLKNHPSVYFLFAGGGPRRQEIESYAEAHGISNFKYLNYFSREDLSCSLSLGDVHLLTLRSDMAGIAVPSKLYGIMAAARPVVMVGPEASESAEVILKDGIGMVVDPAVHGADAAGRLATILVQLCENATWSRELGQRGYTVFLEKYEQRVVCAQWADLLHRFTGNGRRAETPGPSALHGGKA